MVSFKAIKPHTFNAHKSIRTHLMKAVNDTLALAEKDFKRTTRTWETDVQFIVNKAHVVGSDVRGSAGTDNKIYGYVNHGTRAHMIYPRRARVLRFSSGYRAKTRFRTLNSTSGGASGAAVYARGVRHPGSAARQFDVAIAELRQPDFVNAVSEAMVKGTQGS